ncbi:MAG: hypothetical protein JXB62_14740 [Pirellulales bacterium]|nr:hypothetical protein [Pirellulales bacterium]
MNAMLGRAVVPLGLIAALVSTSAAADVRADLEVHYLFENRSNPGYNSVGPHGEACGG